MDNGIGRDPPEHFRIKHLQMSGFQFPQCQFLLAKIRDDGAFQQSLIGTVGCVGQPSLGDLQPFQQIVGEQHITAQVAHFFGRLKFRSEPCQFRLGLALISLFGKSQRDPFRFSLPSGVFVVQHGIILAVFQSQMSCYHFVFLLSLSICRTELQTDSISIPSVWGSLYSANCLIAAVSVRISGRPGSVLSAVSAVPGP